MAQVGADVVRDVGIDDQRQEDQDNTDHRQSGDEEVALVGKDEIQAKDP